MASHFATALATGAAASPDGDDADVNDPVTGAKVAERKLAQLDAAQTLAFMKAPPGNHLEALKDDRKGQHSIRINQQWRVCFVWTAHGAADVEIVDYH